MTGDRFQDSLKKRKIHGIVSYSNQLEKMIKFDEIKGKLKAFAKDINSFLSEIVEDQ